MKNRLHTEQELCCIAKLETALQLLLSFYSERKVTALGDVLDESGMGLCMRNASVNRKKGSEREATDGNVEKTKAVFLKNKNRWQMLTIPVKQVRG